MVKKKIFLTFSEKKVVDLYPKIFLTLKTFEWKLRIVFQKAHLFVCPLFNYILMFFIIFKFGQILYFKKMNIPLLQPIHSGILSLYRVAIFIIIFFFRFSIRVLFVCSENTLSGQKIILKFIFAFIMYLYKIILNQIPELRKMPI